MYIYIYTVMYIYIYIHIIYVYIEGTPTIRRSCSFIVDPWMSILPYHTISMLIYHKAKIALSTTTPYIAVHAAASMRPEVMRFVGLADDALSGGGESG